MSFAAGTRLGSYEIFGLIGAGGMGEVYKAKDTQLDRIAFEIPPSNLSVDFDRRARFEREAKTIASLSPRCRRRGEEDANAESESLILSMTFLPFSSLSLHSLFTSA